MCVCAAWGNAAMKMRSIVLLLDVLSLSCDLLCGPTESVSALHV